MLWKEHLSAKQKRFHLTCAKSALYNGIMGRRSSENVIVKYKTWTPDELSHRHVELMAQMIANPHLTQGELANLLGFNEHHLGLIIKSDLFRFAFKQYQREHLGKVSDLAADATVSALRFSMEVLGKDGVAIEVKQDSAKDILNLGHAKAVEKRASIDAHFELPKEFLGGIKAILDEVTKPFEPTRTIQPPVLSEEEKEDLVGSD